VAKYRAESAGDLAATFAPDFGDKLMGCACYFRSWMDWSSFTFKLPFDVKSAMHKRLR
jgi:hypothetical protein